MEDGMNLQRRETKIAKEEDSALFVPLRCYWCQLISQSRRRILRESSVAWHAGHGTQPL